MRHVLQVYRGKHLAMIIVQFRGRNPNQEKFRSPAVFKVGVPKKTFTKSVDVTESRDVVFIRARFDTTAFRRFTCVIIYGPRALNLEEFEDYYNKKQQSWLNSRLT